MPIISIRPSVKAPPSGVPDIEPEPKPDPEPRPGTGPDVVPPINPGPNPDSSPDFFPPTPEPAPLQDDEQQPSKRERSNNLESLEDVQNLSLLQAETQSSEEMSSPESSALIVQPRKVTGDKVLGGLK